VVQEITATHVEYDYTVLNQLERATDWEGNETTFQYDADGRNT